MNTWVVIPAFNEVKIIGSVIQSVLDRGYNVVVVDDASGDGTFEAAQQTNAVVLEHLINRGQGAALKTGIVYALRQGADTIVTFDADGQHNPDEIALLLKPIIEGKADIVLGSRFLTNGSNVPPLRRKILRLAIIFTRIMSHIAVTDTHNGFRAMNREAAHKIRIVQDRMAHASEILDEIVRHRLRYQEVPVTISYSDYSRGKGQSNLAMFRIASKYLFYKLRN